MTNILLETKNVVKKFDAEATVFGKAKSHIHAVNSVSIQIPRGKTVGLVGESGCGKSTLGRMITRLETTDSGEINFEGHSIFSLFQKRVDAVS